MCVNEPIKVRSATVKSQDLDRTCSASVAGQSDVNCWFQGGSKREILLKMIPISDLLSIV